MRGLLTAGVLVLQSVVGGFAVPRLHSQAADASDQKPPAFEVASVKPNRSGDLQPSARVLPGGRVEFTNITALRLIQTVFVSETIQLVAQIVGGPGWLDEDRFDIVAKGPSNLVLDPGLGQRGRLMVMLRVLLEDRFQLQTHTESRKTNVYALVVANRDRRLGPRLRPSSANCYSVTNPPPVGMLPDAERTCGRTGPNGNIRYLGVTMRQLAASLASHPSVARPVIDKTRLEGRYDLHLEFATPVIPPGGGENAQLPNPVDDAGLFTALTEQAGLKLQRQKDHVNVLVIDHVEKPTPD